MLSVPFIRFKNETYEKNALKNIIKYFEEVEIDK